MNEFNELPSIIETQELVVPRSIPMISPASDAKQRLNIIDDDDGRGDGDDILRYDTPRLLRLIADNMIDCY